MAVTEAGKLLEAAVEKYSAVLALRPEDVWALIGWGDALMLQARRKIATEAEPLFTAGAQQFSAALSLQPNFHPALEYWGKALYEQARQKSGAEAERLYHEAAAKCEAAVSLCSHNHHALRHWGNTLFALGRLKPDSEAGPLFELAAEKLNKALEHRRSDVWAVHSLGLLAAERAARAGSLPEAAPWYQAAAERFEAMLKIRPGHAAALGSWGNMEAARAARESGEASTRLLAMSCERLKAAVDMDPNQAWLQTSYAKALLARARQASGDPGRKLYEEAAQSCAQATALDPGSYDAFHLWGDTLTALGQAAEAAAKYRAALELRPDYAQARVALEETHAQQRVVEELAWQVQNSGRSFVPLPKDLASFDPDLRKQSYLERDDAGNYSFRDNSDMESFVARKLARLLRQGEFAGCRLSDSIVRLVHAMVTAGHKYERKLADGMVLVPAGPFIYGMESQGNLRIGNIAEAFWLDRYPVTNAEYCRFLNERGNREDWLDPERSRIKEQGGAFIVEPEYDDHPMIGVNWHGALEYAEWVGKRLPTEEEWEKAARGIDGRRYPWGEEFSEDACNSWESGIRHTTPVGKYNGKRTSSYGCRKRVGVDRQSVLRR